jgi:hypothetical protein
MRIDALKAALDELSWREQVDFELRERRPGRPVDPTIDEGIRRLARTLTPAMLDELASHHPGYESWVLRLSPEVPGDDARGRADRYRHHPDAEVRYWAGRLRDR